MNKVFMFAPGALIVSASFIVGICGVYGNASQSLSVLLAEIGGIAIAGAITRFMY